MTQLEVTTQKEREEFLIAHGQLDKSEPSMLIEGCSYDLFKAKAHKPVKVVEIYLDSLVRMAWFYREGDAEEDHMSAVIRMITEETVAQLLLSEWHMTREKFHSNVVIDQFIESSEMDQTILRFLGHCDIGKIRKLGVASRLRTALGVVHWYNLDGSEQHA